MNDAQLIAVAGAAFGGFVAVYQALHAKAGAPVKVVVGNVALLGMLVAAGVVAKVLIGGPS